MALKPLRSFAETTPDGLTTASEIQSRVKAARPLMGGTIPANFRDRLGTTHYDGHYHLTDRPFLIEGAEQIHRLGMNVAKFWLRENGLPGYGYNSDWGIDLNGKLVDVISHRYFKAALSQPFKTVMLEVSPMDGAKGSTFGMDSKFAAEEEQFYEVTSYLIKAYADRDITFILQNWEGDWMLRRNEGGTWDKVPATEVRHRCDAFIRFLSARQSGVERARREAGASRCKVYHAAEVNRVWDGTKGIPTITTHVLPFVTLDLVSWSCYDGMNNVVQAWRGIELIRKSMRSSPIFGDNAVYIGEVGMAERNVPEPEIVDFWDRAIGVFLALGVPWFVHWELYCNEPVDLKTKSDRTPRKADELRGFWLIRPDGSLSHSGKYLTALLQNAGNRLPEETIRTFKTS